ncbi:MAG: transposase, partial [Opitutales bacterium]
FTRKRLHHGMPPWVKDGETYFITINCGQRGVQTLTIPENATAIKDAIQHYTTLGKWWPRLVVLMPDHLHALLSLNTARHTIRQIIAPWKSYLKKTRGIDWQDDFFEHRIRNQDSLEEKAHYIRQNPVRAGLVEDPKDWPYIWTESDFKR